MNIYIKFDQNKNSINTAGSVYKYVERYIEENNEIKILSSEKLTVKEINSLGKIYFHEKNILEKGYIDLVIDKYIIDKN